MELSPHSRRRWPALLAVLLLAATAATYSPSMDGEFVLDDDIQIRDPLVTRPLAQGASAWLTSSRPLLTATFAVNYATSGLRTRGWHVTNVGIHLLAIVLVWGLAHRLLARAGLDRPDGSALAIAALFALHPMQTEAVSYVVQRGEALASAIYVAVLLLLLLREDADRRSKRNWLLAAAVGLHLLGILTKPIAATLPVAWLLLVTLLPAAAEAGSRPWRRVARHLPETLPFFVISVGSLLWGLVGAAGTSHSGFDMPDVTPVRYVATQLRVIPTYLRLLAWPSGQCVDWDVRLSSGLFEPRAAAGGAFLILLAAGSIWLALRSARTAGDSGALAKLTGFGVSFFLVLLAPSSSVVPLHDPLAEHRVYLASLGIALVVVAASTVLLRRLLPGRAIVIGSVLTATALAALAGATARRNMVWRGLLPLYEDAERNAPEKGRVQANLGLGLANAGRHAEAIGHFRRAIVLAADRTTEPGKNLQNLLSSLMALGLTDTALQEADQYLAGRPGDGRALAFRGYIRFARGNRDEGLADLERSLTILPGDPQALVLLANVEYVGGRDAQAAAAARAALQRDPDNGLALEFLGLASARAGDLRTARDALRAAAGRGRSRPALLLQLGAVEERLGDPGGACSVFASILTVPVDSYTASAARAARLRLGCR